MSWARYFLSWRDLVDVAVATLLIWGAMTWLRRSKALPAFVGLCSQAAVTTGTRFARFALHLPLSTDHAQLDGVGTRRAAALGSAERCDALVVVVSEERGSVSVACGGVIRRLHSPQELTGER